MKYSEMRITYVVISACFDFKPTHIIQRAPDDLDWKRDFALENWIILRRRVSGKFVVVAKISTWVFVTRSNGQQNNYARLMADTTKNVAATSRRRNESCRSKSPRVGETTACKTFSVDTDQFSEIFSPKKKREGETRYG